MEGITARREIQKHVGLIALCLVSLLLMVLILIYWVEVDDMASQLFVCEGDEYSMEGSCKNNVKFGNFGVAEAGVNGGRVSKRFKGEELCFLFEGGMWLIQKARGGTSSFIEMELEHEKSFSSGGGVAVTDMFAPLFNT
ncbi:hypothetical protein RJT34_16634 [Clitoria ternatea]|uniref:Uncharacterized protein n=1 Tax=Clitoria ternatea TaxID=43366 RepID=A0AAN9J930_CLITE